MTADRPSRFPLTSEQRHAVSASFLGWTLDAFDFFVLLADRYGRRTPLMANVVFFSVVELLCGFAPNYTVFLILRAIYGIGMGGEWGVGASLAIESVPAKWRGTISGIVQSGYSCNRAAPFCRH